MEERPYHLILYGATGFTGGLTAEYLLGKSGLAPKDWAIAGRDIGKLQAVRKRLEAIDPAASEIGLITANSNDPASLRAMTAQGRAVATTVGPYALYGKPLAEACVETGSHYLDITGEPAYVKDLLGSLDERARQKGVFLVNCCGFDSIPADMGAWFAAGLLPDDGPKTVKAFVFSKGTFSGGTWASALNAMAEGLGSGKKAPKPSRGKSRLDKSIHFDKAIKKWAVPMPVIDPWIVARSAGMQPARYGNDFQYGQYLGISSLPTLAGLLGGVGLVYLGAQFKPTRKLLEQFRKSGEGPSEEQRAKSFFRVTLYAHTPSVRKKVTVSGGDPGYTETSKMLSETALALLENYDRLPVKGGVVTPAGALGEFLLPRLQAAGIRFESVDL